MVIKRGEQLEKYRETDAKSVDMAKRLVRNALKLDESALRRAGREIWELESVLRADYEELPGLPSAADAKDLAQLVRSAPHPLHEGWNKEGGHGWSGKVRGCDPRDIALRATPYTDGAGLELWGFSCAMKEGGRNRFVIYLNTAHLPGAIALTAAHELGHYFYYTRRSDRTDVAFAPMAASLTAHLRDPGEVFADSSSALAAFDSSAARELARLRHRQPEETAALARALVKESFRIDFGSAATASRWRIRYLAASIHFARLRAALRRVAGV